jgi:hypothetical protein
LFSTIFVKLLGVKRRYLAAGLSALGILAYTLLVGAGASVMRAALMRCRGFVVMRCYNSLRTDLNGWIELTTDGKQM